MAVPSGGRKHVVVEGLHPELDSFDRIAF